MAGEGFNASISSAAGFKGDAASFKHSSSGMPRPVHQGFTHQISQPGARNIYLLAIRNMMEQGFHSFVSVQPKDETMQQNLPSLQQFNKTFQRQSPRSTMGSTSLSMKNKGENEFLASTPQYLLPQFQRNAQKSQTPLYNNQFQQLPRERAAGQNIQNFSQPVLNELTTARKEINKGLTGSPSKQLSSGDAENMLLEHYRSTFISSKDTYRSKFSQEQISQQSNFHETPTKSKSGASKGVYADAYKGITQSRKKSEPHVEKGSNNEARESPGEGAYYIKMKSVEKKTGFTKSSSNHQLKMELPKKKPAFTLGSGDLRIKMMAPEKEKKEQMPGNAELEGHTRSDRAPGQIHRDFRGKSEVSDPQKQGPMQKGSIQDSEKPRPEPLRTDAPSKAAEVPQGKILGQGIKSTVKPDKMSQEASSHQEPKSPSSKEIPVKRETMPPVSKDGTPLHRGLTKAVADPGLPSQKQQASEGFHEEAPGKILGQGVRTPTGTKEPGVHQHLMPDGQTLKQQPELLRTRSPGERWEAPQRATGDGKTSRNLTFLPEGREKLNHEPSRDPAARLPRLSEMSPEHKAEALLERLERQDREMPVKGKEQLYKPWERAASNMGEQKQLQNTPGAEEKSHYSEEAKLSDQKMSTFKKPFEHAEITQSRAESAPLPRETPQMPVENKVERLREEIKQKLESPQAPAMSQREMPGELAAKTGVLQSQGMVRQSDEKGAPRKTHPETVISPGSSKERAPIGERSYTARKTSEKSQDENPIRKKGDGPIESIRGLGERGPLPGGAILASEMAQQETRQPALPAGKLDLRQGEGSHKIVDEVRKDQRDSRDEEQGQGEQGGFQGQGRERKPGFGKTGISPYATSRETILQREQHLNQQAQMKQEVVQESFRDTLRLQEAKRQQPLKYAQVAAQHASTCIESILKKSHQETWTGEEMAAKIIALLMRSASTYTYDHSSRVTDLSIALAKEMGMDDDARLKQIEEGAMFHDIGELELDLESALPHVQARLSKYIGTVDLKNCSFLHDIGKVKIPESILYKPTRLTDEEFEIIKRHPVIGEEIIRPIPSLQHALPVVRHHHEKWDGTGYPDGLKGAEIPLAARIVGITDSFDAMVSDRPYRKGMPVEEAINELKRGAGTQFDPKLVAAFLKVIEREY